MESAGWSEKARAALTEKGLAFTPFEAPAGALHFAYPQGWRVDWREDHAVVRHGVPPKGHLTIFPVPGDAPGPEALLTAFINEFAAPAADGLDLTHMGPLPGEEGLSGARFSIRLAGATHQGVALTARDRGLSVVVAYWVEEALFNKELVTLLVKGVLGSVEVSPRSPLAPPLPQGVLPVAEGELWQEELPDGAEPYGSRPGRFALRLPEGWRCEDVSAEDGERAWMLIPPGASLEAPAEDVVIAVTSEDLYGSLEDTMHEAAVSLDPQGLMRIELPVMTVERGDQRAMIRLFVSHPEGEGLSRPPVQRLWSCGWTDEGSVVHVVAVGEANRIHALLPDLTAIAASLRVLPRPVDAEAMEALAGAWRHQTYPNPRELSLVAEHVYALGADGRFTLTVEERFVVPPNPDEVALAARLAEGGEDLMAVGEGRRQPAPGPDEANDVAQAEGDWDLVEGRLTLRYDDGGVEVHTLDSHHGRMAIVSGVLWERR